jgi:phosphate/sulfate permease
MAPDTIIIVLALIFGFYMAWSIGANDVANAMGTSVGSGALTLKKAIIIASVLEFSGAFLVGSHVSETIRKGIVDTSIFIGHADIFVYGMLAALLTAAVWLQVASYFGWPVSTTHSIVGSILGFGILVGGVKAIHWGKIISISLSWVISPVLSATIAFILFNILRYKIYYQPDPLKATKKVAPYLIFSVFFVLTLVLLFKGLKNLHLSMSFFQASLIAVGVGIISAIVGKYLLRNIKDEYEEKTESSEEWPGARLKFNLYRAQMRLETASRLANGELKEKLSSVLHSVKEIGTGLYLDENVNLQRRDVQGVERIFAYLQILSAAFVAFAHGANDVANAVGPLAAIITVLKTGLVSLKAPVPPWTLMLGGIGIVIGLATWGWRVMLTIGKKITELTPSRGFSAEFSAAITILLASKLGLPISTTHTLVGAVLGVGMARGFTTLDMRVIRNIAISWIITIPVGAVGVVIIYHILRFLFM